MSTPTPPEEPVAVVEADVVFDPARLDALASTGLAASGPEGTFDRLTRLVQLSLRVPVALVSLVESDRQVFKSHQGLAEPWCSVGETPLSHSFCQHVVRRDAPLAVEDAREDPLVRDNGAVRDLGLVAYLGTPLRTPEGHVLGSLCALDGQPRAWTDGDREALAALAEVAMDEIAMRYRAQTLGQAGAERLGAMTTADLAGPETNAAFDRLARVACRELGTASALVTVLGVLRHVTEGRPAAGPAGVTAVEGLDALAIARDAPLLIGNTATSPHVGDLAPVRAGGVAAYLGVPVRAPGGGAIGSLSVWDARPRAWTDGDVATLEDLAQAVGAEVAARASLRERGEVLFRSLFDGLSQLTGLLDTHGTVIEANRTALAFAGLDRVDVVGRPLWEALDLPPDVEARHRDAVERAGAGEAVRYEEAVTDAAGREHVLDVSLKPVPDSPDRLLLEGRDVTEAIRLRRVQSAMMVGMAGTWEVDLQTGRVAAHGGTAALFGLDPEGGPYTIDAYYDRLHPDDAEDARRHLQALSHAGGEYEVERRVVWPDGSLRYIRSRGVVLAGPDGRPARILGALTDTTEQRQEAAAVSRTAAELQIALDAARMGRWEVDLGGGPVTQDARVREAHGLPPGDEPASFEEVIATIHPDDRDRVVDHYRDLAQRGPGASFVDEYRVVHPDGAARWFHITGEVRDDMPGGRIVGVAWDVTPEREAEAAMSRNERRLQLALESAEMGTFEADPATGRTETDDRARAVLGLSEDVGLEAFAERVHPDDRAAFTAFADAVASGVDAPSRLEYRIVDDDRAVRWIASSTWAQVEDGRVGRVIGTVRDATARKRAEAALRESEQRYRTLFESVTFGFCLVDLVLGEGREVVDYRFVETNPMFSEQSGLGDVEGKLFSEVAPGIEPGWAEMFGAVAETGTSARRTDYSGPLGRWFDVYAARVGGAGSRRIGLLFTDVTEQREAEHALRESQSRLDLALRGADLGTWDWEVPTGRAVFDERWASMLGYGLDELAPDVSTWETLVHPDDLETVRPILAAHLSGEAPAYEAEFRMRTKDGSWRWILARGRVVERDADGAPQRVVGTHLDVTDRKQAESALRALNDELEDRVAARTAELARSNAELDQFAYVASHDLKAPIRAIDSLAAWIAEDAGDVLPPDSARHLDLLRRRAGRMEGLLDSLLAYSRAGRTGAPPRPVDTADLVREVAETVAPPGGFDVRIEGDLPVVETAPTPLALVLRNLIGNAIKHHDRADGRVTVSARVLDTEDGGYAEFTVADDGPGIEAAYRGRVFGLFQTLRPRDEVEGSGMGLAIVKKTVESWGGEVVLEPSDARGATFRFTWPLAPAP